MPQPSNPNALRRACLIALALAAPFWIGAFVAIRLIIEHWR